MSGNKSSLNIDAITPQTQTEDDMLSSPSSKAITVPSSHCTQSTHSSLLSEAELTKTANQTVVDLGRINSLNHDKLNIFNNNKRLRITKSVPIMDTAISSDTIRIKRDHEYIQNTMEFADTLETNNEYKLKEDNDSIISPLRGKKKTFDVFERGHFFEDIE